ncbi:REP-associated tyrosine transposase [Stratiformator vulcanicus]|uniref:Transposase IS200 like protein n=1 Tax=Stratiformator vulcanicus TaxID=2527980 RepID=A0A517R478_9PLAN|nr:transposase [Stratiformator vulcanicus]QDT38695.1 Transposase IS200 like protein [Stratiformator vulcanicus]
MSHRQVIDDQPTVHFLTFSCFKRRKLLQHDKQCRIVLGQLGQRLSDRSGLCLGFVLMPDHVHAMVWFPTPGQLCEFMDVWKMQTSSLIARHYEIWMPKYWNGLDDKTVWQARYYDFNVLNIAKAEEKLNYMHLNPVRAGLVDRATDWRWSSVGWYELGRSVGVPIGWPDSLE